ncbi:MAG TPA: sensor histidine kinase [Candidatus Limnocylindrales bacterium]|nr:sensor histidine kinase [Candidatus Limnocylindrales bacterium]
MRRRWGLATRMTLAVVVLLIPLQVAIVASNVRTSDERRLEEVHNAELVGENVVEVLDGFLRSLEATTLAIALAVANQTRPIDQANDGEQLARLLESYGVLRALFITDPRGIVTVSGLGTGVGVDVSERPYLLELQAGADLVWSGSLSGIESGEITIALGRPIRDASGAVLGYLVTAFHPQVVLDDLDLALPADARVVLADDEGLVLYDTTRPTLSAAERDVSGVPEFAAALAGQRVRVERGLTALTDGEPRYGAVYPLPRTGWTLAFTRPLAPVEAALGDRLRSDILGATFIILLAALFAALAANRLTRPIRTMAEAARAIAAGERHAVPAVDVSDVEVAQLAQAMRVMSESVASREDDLRFLAEASAALSSSLDYEETLRSVARLAVPAIADWCFVDVVEAGTVRRIEVIQREPEKEHVARAFAERYVPDPSDPRSVIGGVMARAEPLLVPQVTDDALRALAATEELHELYLAMRPLSAIIVPLRARGRVHGAISLVTTPASGRHYGDGELALAEELAHRAGTAVENALLYREVETALRTRDEFLAAAAHELKTPLASIKGLAQLLRRRAPGTDDAGTSDKLARIDAAATRMAHTVDELLDLTRLRLDRTLDLERSKVDLVALARDAVTDHQAAADRHVFRLEARVPEAVGRWDRARLERVVGNLLTNAVKFSPDGGEVVVTVDTSDGAAVLMVQDQGMGIPREDLGLVFERFRRGRNVIGRIPGTGIGLALVRQVVEQHGGSVGVDSRPEAGSVFTVRLPFEAGP